MHTEPVDCAGTPPEGTVCVPGGAFLLGSVAAFSGDSVPERLVRVSPFALEIDEVTITTVKLLLAEGRISREPEEPPDVPDPTGMERGGCRYQALSSEHDDKPVNCLDHELAREICAARDMRLPTEAEWEWAAGNLTRETTYPWGDDDDVCPLAIVGRGRFVSEATGFAEADNCRGAAEGEGVIWGSVAGGDADDITELGIRNLGGNVSEWVQDAHAAYDAPCFMPESNLLENPQCTEGDVITTRGGGWAGAPIQARVFERNSESATSTIVDVGLRCARSM